MNDQPTIVRATLEHLEMATVLFDGYRQSYGQDSDVAGAREFLSERLKQDQSVIFLALRLLDNVPADNVPADKKDDLACGFTQLYPTFSSVSLRPVWILNDLFVPPPARRQGIGKRLLQTAAEFAAKRGAKRLTLATGVDNRGAQRLYEQLGWRQDRDFVHYNYEL